MMVIRKLFFFLYGNDKLNKKKIVKNIKKKSQTEKLISNSDVQDMFILLKQMMEKKVINKNLKHEDVKERLAKKLKSRIMRERKLIMDI